MEESKQSEMIKTALERAKSLFDAGTILGSEIKATNGTSIFPVAKISVGVASGGLDYFTKSSGDIKNFGGGGGTGVNIVPLGFLVVNKLGNTSLLTLDQGERDFSSYLFDFIGNSPDFIDKIKSIFTNKNKNDNNWFNSLTKSST